MGHVTNMREKCVHIWCKTEGKRLIVRPRRRWEDNTKMVPQGVGWVCGMHLSASGQGKAVFSSTVISESLAV
jgi:hypothetical protein